MSADPPIERELETRVVAPEGKVVLFFYSRYTEEGVEKETEFHVIVSAPHLALKSRVWRVMLLNRGLKEGAALHGQGRVEIPLPDDDFDAFLIILNVLHCNRREVPRKVDIGDLEDVADLVDKYEWHEVLEDDAERWTWKIRRDFPKAFTDRLPVYLWVSWVFGLRNEFKKLMRVAIMESRGAKDLALLKGKPFPNAIIGKSTDSRAKTSNKIPCRESQAVPKGCHISHREGA